MEGWELWLGIAKMKNENVADMVDRWLRNTLSQIFIAYVPKPPAHSYYPDQKKKKKKKKKN